MNEPSTPDQLSPADHGSGTPGRRAVSRGRRHLLRGAIGLAAGLTAVLASAGLAGASVAMPGASAIPVADIVGTGLVNCGAVTGEVGFSPATITGGTAVDVVSIWLQGLKCTPARGSVATRPVPKTVVLSMSFTTTNACPLTNTIGGGTANFAYNYPPAPSPMIDPSVATNVSVTGAPTYAPAGFWRLFGQVNWGSYPSPPASDFEALIHLANIGKENCRTGVTSMYVNAGRLLNV